MEGLSQQSNFVLPMLHRRLSPGHIESPDVQAHQSLVLRAGDDYLACAV